MSPEYAEDLRTYVAGIRASIVAISAQVWEYDETSYKDELIADLHEACAIAEAALIREGFKP